MRHSPPRIFASPRLSAVLIAALSLLAAGCRAVHTSASTAPAASPSRSTTRVASSSTSTPQSSPDTALTSFATAYARYLDGRLTARDLPATTPAAQAQAGTPLPPSAREGPLILVSLQPLGTARMFLITLRDHVHTFTVPVALTHAGAQWQITQIVPPNIAEVLPPPAPPAAPPHVSADVAASARAFLHRYLAWLYGHAPAAAITHATPSLIAKLEHSPPRVPPAFQTLHGRTAAVDTTPAAAGSWKAVAAVTDGQNTYNLSLTLVNDHGSWLVTKVSSLQ